MTSEPEDADDTKTMTDDTNDPDFDEPHDINDGNGLEIANPNDFFHKRDGDDKLSPVVQKIPGRDQALRVIPPTLGDLEKFHLDDEGRLYDDDELYAEFLNEHFPDLDEVTEEDVSEGMLMFATEVFVDVAKRAGGLDMKDALDQRQTKQMMQMLGADEGNLDLSQLIEAGNAASTDED